MERIPMHNETLKGNQKYRGFCVELLEKISEICNFTYTINKVEDGYMGSYINGKWNGIVGNRKLPNCYRTFQINMAPFSLSSI